MPPVSVACQFARRVISAVMTGPFFGATEQRRAARQSSMACLYLRAKDLHSAILCPAIFTIVVGNGSTFTVTFCRQTVLIHSVIYEPIHDRVGSILRELLIEGLAADVIREAFNSNRPVRIVLHCFGYIRQYGFRAARDIELSRGEMNLIFS